MPTEKNPGEPSSPSGEGRKNTKPVMEKKRRARINASLSEMKALLLDVLKKEGTRHSKMEKADILEMTVKHLRQIQRQQFAVAANVDPAVLNKYQAGFNECASEVTTYLSNIEGVDVELRARLLNHLANCVTGIHQVVHTAPQTAPTQQAPTLPTVANIKPLQVAHIKPPVVNSEQACSSTTRTPIKISPSPSGQSPSSASTCAIGTAASDSLSLQCSLQSSHQPNLIISPINAFYNGSTATHGNISNYQNTISYQTTTPNISSPCIPNTVVSPIFGQEQPKIISGVQLIQTRLQTGELAFVVPNSVVPLTSGQVPSYVIPVYGATNTVSLEQANNAVVFPSLNKVQSSGLCNSQNVLSTTNVSPKVPTIQTSMSALNLSQGFPLTHSVSGQVCSSTTSSNTNYIPQNIPMYKTNYEINAAASGTLGVSFPSPVSTQTATLSIAPFVMTTPSSSIGTIPPATTSASVNYNVPVSIAAPVLNLNDNDEDLWRPW